METAIKKAIEGGAFGDPEKMKKINWFIGKGEECDLLFFDNGLAGVTVSLYKQFCNPKFWQAIGKVEGWSFIGTSDIPQTVPPRYVNEAVRFMQWIMDGKDINNFFENLWKK